MPRVAFLAALLAGGLASGCGSEPAPVRRVLVVTIDTLRADRLGYAGYDVETPNLDRLARSGTHFTEAMSVAPLTLPSHASLFTGLYPPGHGVRANGVFHLDDRVETLAETLREAGFATGAFVGAFVLEHRFGLDQGFDRYDDELPEENPVNRVYYPERPAGEVATRALEWIRAQGEAPFFAWVHVFDPHAPYAPPAPFDERYAGRPYAGEIAYTDAALGPLLDRVSAMDDSLIVVTSDHGESLGEHGESTHGLFIYDATTRVPLVLSGAGVPEDRRVDGLVRSVDVAPTVLELAGLAPLEEIDGESLVPFFDPSSPLPPRSAYAESFLPRLSFNWNELRSLRREGWKLIQAPRPELFDLSTDPAEANDLWSEPPSAEGKALARELARLVDSDSGLTPTAELDPETTRRLESLGYVASTARGAAEERERPDPKDRIEVYERMQALLSPELSVDEVLAGYRELLEREPTNNLARNRLANTLSEQGRLDEAIDEFRLLVRESEIDFTGFENLAAALLLERRTEEALATTEMALAAAPWNPDFHVLHGEALEQASRLEEALAAYGEAVALEPTAENLWRRGAVAERLGRSSEAESDLRRALEREPSFEPALAALVRLLARTSRAAEAESLLDAAGYHDSVELASARAEVLLASGRLAEARAILERARRESPSNTRVLALLGPLYGQEGNLEAAAAVLEEALGLGETAPEVQRNLGLVYLRQGRAHDAVTELEAASRAAPDDPSVWYSLGNALVRSQRLAPAVAAFERALELRSPWPEAAFNLAVAAEQAGEVDKARTAYRAFLASASASDTARRAEAEKRLNGLGGSGPKR